MPVEDDRRYPKRPLVGVGAIMFRRDRVLHGAARQGAAERLVVAARRRARNRREPEGRRLPRSSGRDRPGSEPLGVFEIFERIMRDDQGVPEYHYVLIDYICRVTGGKLCPGDDVDQVEWVRRADLPKLQITEGTLGVIEKAFQERRKYEAGRR